MKRINLNPVIVPDNVDDFSETSESQILNIKIQIPEIIPDFLREQSFNEIAKNISKYKIQKNKWITFKKCNDSS